MKSNNTKQQKKTTTNEEDQLIQSLLQISRDKIAEGKGQEALEAVIRAIIAHSGEGSIMRILNEANNRAKKEKEKEIRIMIEKCIDDLLNAPSILSELGDEDILVDAFEDGSSVICQKCKGLISVDRAEAHAKFWCDSITEEDDDA